MFHVPHAALSFAKRYTHLASAIRLLGLSAFFLESWGWLYDKAICSSPYYAKPGDVILPMAVALHQYNIHWPRTTCYVSTHPGHNVVSVPRQNPWTRSGHTNISAIVHQVHDFVGCIAYKFVLHLGAAFRLNILSKHGRASSPYSYCRVARLQCRSERRRCHDHGPQCAIR